VAHPVPPAVRQELERQLAPYRAARPDVRWTSPHSWHLTLLFLGSVDPARVAELERLVEDVAARAAPYDVRADDGGGRARERDGVAWLGLSTGGEALIGVADLVVRGCPPAITEGPAPKRTPSAHLTIARRADRDLITALHTAAYGPLGVAWTVERLALVRSHLGPGGASYQTLREATL
jgi:2'-5' RNA ligase